VRFAQLQTGEIKAGLTNVPKAKQANGVRVKWAERCGATTEEFGFQMTLIEFGWFGMTTCRG
jgi:hypothetical protein